MSEEEPASWLGFTIEDLHLVMAVLFGALLAIQAWDSRQVLTLWNETPTGNEVVGEIASALLGPWAMPFEVLSILLLVALIGAVALAMREDDSTEGT